MPGKCSGPDYEPYARRGTCVQLDGGCYRVRGAKRWWVVDLAQRKCGCGEYLAGVVVGQANCLHLRTLETHLKQLGEGSLPAAELRPCRLCGIQINVTGMDKKRNDYRYCGRCRWRDKQHSEVLKSQGLRSPSRQWRTTAPALISPTTPDLHWAAGFLEGEACFSGGNTGRKREHRIVVAQTNPEPLHKLRCLFGGTVALSKRRKDFKPTWSDQYRWRVSGSRAHGIQLTLFCLLSKRRQDQIKIEWGMKVPEYLPAPREKRGRS